MKKISVVVMTAIYMSLCLSGCQEIKLTPPDIKTIPLPQKEWTFLFYDDADFAGAYDPFNDFSRFVSSGHDINYVVLRDRIDSKAAYYQIGNNHEQKLLQQAGEVNMSAGQTLEDFLAYAKHYFPAKRYIVAFYDHGGGWQGACFDVTNDTSWNIDALTPREIDDAFSNCGGVDLVLFTAPCLMGSLEAAYQARNSAQYYIGSEDLSGFVYWYNMLDRLDAFIKSNPLVSDGELSRETISLLYENRNNFPGGGEELTMGVVQTSRVGDFVSSLTLVTEYYRGHLDKFREIKQLNFKRYDTFADVYDLLTVMQAYESDTLARNLIANAMNCFRGCVIAECHGNLNEHSFGLNIFFPTQTWQIQGGTQLYYPPGGVGLDFKNDCSWDDLVYSCLSTTPGKTGLLARIFLLDGFRPGVRD